MTLKFRCDISKSAIDNPEGIWVAKCIELGLMTQGKSYSNAKKALKECVGYLIDGLHLDNFQKQQDREEEEARREKMVYLRTPRGVTTWNVSISKKKALKAFGKAMKEFRVQSKGDATKA